MKIHCTQCHQEIEENTGHSCPLQGIGINPLHLEEYLHNLCSKCYPRGNNKLKELNK